MYTLAQPHAPPLNTMSPDFTSRIASSTESHTFFLLGTGPSALALVLYALRW